MTGLLRKMLTVLLLPVRCSLSQPSAGRKARRTVDRDNHSPNGAIVQGATVTVKSRHRAGAAGDDQ